MYTQNVKNLVIYGAQAIALGTYKAIKELFPARLIGCFLVTERGNNAETLAGIPVRELADYAAALSQEEKENIEILIATPEAVMADIEESLKAAGFCNYVRMDSLRWAQLQQLAFVRSGKFMPLASYPVGTHKPQIQVYKAKFFKDKKLCTDYTSPEYMVDLQVGSALTDVRVAELQDHTQDHISGRNPNYSELTGLYWIWKNRVLRDDDMAAHYYGLAHYRRMLELSEDDLLRLQDNDIDVVLPYPMPYEPDIEEHHKRYLSESEWNAVLQALKEVHPEEYDAFAKVLKQEYMYNYNIILAKGTVLAEYCAWLFPVLFRIEELCDPDGRKTPNRYMGYIAETLETFYFMNHRQELRITHVGCRFLT